MVPRVFTGQNLRVCPGVNTVLGVDVSGYQPNTDWDRVQKAGMRFAFIKATEGEHYVNKEFKRDWAETKARGIIRGAYHFFHPNIDPHLQAYHFLRTVGPIDELPAVLDWEVTDKVTNQVSVQNALNWLEHVEHETRKTPIIYTGPGFFNQLKNPYQFFKYPLWIANYEVICPKIPPPWSSWVFWQNGQGHVDGVHSKTADLNIFNGDINQLRLFAAR